MMRREPFLPRKTLAALAALGAAAAWGAAPLVAAPADPVCTIVWTQGGRFFAPADLCTGGSTVRGATRPGGSHTLAFAAINPWGRFTYHLKQRLDSAAVEPYFSTEEDPANGYAAATDFLFNRLSTPPAEGAVRRPDERIRLIVRGDDFGNTHAANSILEEAFRDGSISAASLLVPAPWFAQAATIARAQPEWSVGLHLTVTAEWDNLRWGPVAPEDEVPSLVAPDGYFYQRGYGSGQPDPECPNCAWKSADPAEVERELSAQIERARQHGLRVDYIDCHMYVTCQPDLHPIMQKLSAEHCIPIADMGFLGERRARLPEGSERDNYASLREGVKEMLRSLTPGLWLFVSHPSADTPELRAISSTRGEELARERNADLEVWRDPEVKRVLREEGVELVGVRELWDYDTCRVR